MFLAIRIQILLHISRFENCVKFCLEPIFYFLSRKLIVHSFLFVRTYNFNFNKDFWQFSFVLYPELATWKLLYTIIILLEIQFTKVILSRLEVNRFRLTYQKLLDVTVCSSNNVLYATFTVYKQFIGYCKNFFK